MEGISVVRAVLCAVIGYLLGDIQTAVLISRHVYQDDVRKYGSHNAGTTNMTRVFGLRPGVITFLGDFLKGVAAYWAGYLLMGRTGAYIGSLFAVLGHCYPAFAGFKGGKAVATTCGIGLMLSPVLALIAYAVGGLVLWKTKRVSPGSLTGVLVFLILVLVFRHSDIQLVVLTILLSALVFVRHRENIKRLLKGEEAPIVPKSASREENKKTGE